MNALTVVFAATPIPVPVVPPSTVPDNLVTPTIVGFLVTFAVAVATVLLILDMTRRLRRVRYRGELREQLEREAADAATKPGDSSQR